jgi:hypothetical protein
MADFLPLKQGLVLEYALKDAEGEGRLRFEVLAVEQKGQGIKAKCQRTITRPESEGSQIKYTVTKDPAKGWLSSSAWGKEFPLPPVVGKKWRSGSDACRVDALDAVAETPAGKFEGCLRVLRLVAGGDEGSEERLYAPGVGLLRAVSNDESDAYKLALLKKP